MIDEEYEWIRLKGVWCDFCEKEIVIGQKIMYVYFPSGKRFLVHSYHINAIRDGAKPS